MINSIEQAKELDNKDILSDYRALFHIPKLNYKAVYSARVR
jgi:hypothetical protein